MQNQPFDHTPSNEDRHEDAAEFEAVRRFTVEFGPATTKEQIRQWIDEARTRGDADMVSVLLDELDQMQLAPT